MRITILIIVVSLASWYCREKAHPAKKVVNTSSEEVVLPTAGLTDTVSKEKEKVSPDYDTTAWAEVVRLAPSILLDLRYATENNFVKEKMYDCPRCFLRPEVAKAVIQVHQELQKQGLGLKMYDCYRPRPVQWKLWDKVPDTNFVADPRKGSMHNRGVAVDLTIVDSTGKELDMGTGYDYFEKEAYHDYYNLPEPVLKNRKLLLEVMKKYGLQHTRTEWWHYSYQRRRFPLDDWLWPCK
jgi:D-alanyl-D-alanine dipeptidase